MYSTHNFLQDCITCNNLRLMAATKVCNYYDTPGFTNQGPGNSSVMLNGLNHHFMTTASRNNMQSCGLSYFKFDNSVSCANSNESGNINEEILNDQVAELKCDNPYCSDLHHLG